MKKTPLIILLLVIAAVAYRVVAVESGSAGGKGGKNDDKPVPVVAAKATTQELHDNVEVLGTAYANESIDITTNATERLSEVLFTDGQFVAKNDVIARLEQEEEQAALAVMELQFNEHQREYNRLKGLLKNKAASQRDVDERQTLMKVAEQEVEGLKARIADRTLTAPFAGVLGIRRMSVGALVQPGDIITTLDDIHEIKLDFTVPSIYLSYLKPGLEIEAKSDAYGERVFSGHVHSVDTRVNATTRAVLVRAILQNPDDTIKPGVLMQVTVLKDKREALVIPEEAVTQRADSHFVMQVNADTQDVSEVQITPGARRPGTLEVLDGLSAGDLVIVRGIEQVKDGGKVELKTVWDGVQQPEDLAPAGGQ